VFVASDGGLKDSATTKITVTNTNRKPVANPSPTTAQRNSSATITLSATDPDGDALSGWQIIKGPFHGIQVPNPTMPIILYTPASGYIGKDSISYAVSDGSLTSDIGLLVITVDSSKIAPQITTEPRADTTVNSGTAITVSFTVKTNDCFPAPTFTWYKAGVATSVATTQTYTKTGITLADSGNYYVIVENIAGKDSSNNAHLTVITPPSIKTQPASQTVCENGNATFTVEANGTGPFTYLWKKGGAAITDANASGANTTTLKITSATAANAGQYTCVVTNSIGTPVTSSAATLAVNTLSTVPTSITASSSTLCPGSSVTLTINGGSLESGSTWKWYKDLSFTQPATVTAVSGYADGSKVTVSQAGTYYVQAEGSGPCGKVGAGSVYSTVAVKTYTITASAVGNGTISPNGTTSVTCGNDQAYTFSPSSGYKITDVLIDNASAGTLSSYTFKNVQSDHTIQVTFAQITYTLTSTVSPSNSGTITPASGTFVAGANTSLSASAKSGYHFSSWTVNGSASGNTNPLPLTMNGDKSVTANFIPEYTVTFNSQGGSSVDAQTIPQGDTVVIPAIPTKPKSYSFDSWYTDQSGTSKYNFHTSVTGTLTLYAKWLIKDIDGNIYDTVVIGTQTWMVQNLRTTRYNDNNPITHITNDATAWSNNTAGAYCFYGNNIDAAYKEKWGALYNWYAVVNPSKLAPDGWHVPTNAEWEILQNYLIANGYNWDGTTTDNKIAKSLAAKTDWDASSTTGAPGNNSSINNRSGFSGLPGGKRTPDFTNLSTEGYWWSATENGASSYAISRTLFNYFEGMYNGYLFSKSCGFSVRLVRD
jgi:uncharacterized protein (TIGR02145 family)/uncharacterized repeat protein (TIGR02543 family)